MKGLSSGTPGGITIRPSLARQGPSQDEALKQIQSFLMQERRLPVTGRGGGWFGFTRGKWCNS
ncbi:hypothetical protein ES702_04732 [subsurface metagenome]